jgi:hypothetical protein
MTATITADNGAGTTTPHFVIAPYATDWQARNVVHDLVGGGIAVSLVPPRPRSGSLELLYLTEADAFACAALHKASTTFTLTETSRTHVSMTYATSGSVTVRLDGNANTWIVTVGYQEVTP